MRIAFLGTGLMGAGFVKRMLDLGHTVQVWNRTKERAEALRPLGAIPCPSAHDAVVGVDAIHLCLPDDAVVDQVLEPLAGAIGNQVPLIDHSTTSPLRTAERIQRWTVRGVVFLHAPVFMSPKNTADGTGVMLISGNQEQIERVLPRLTTMTTRVLNLGPRPESAAAFKLFGNLALLGTNGLIADILRLAAAADISPEDAVTLFREFNPGEFFPGRAERIAKGTFMPPSFTVAMARKDIGLMLDEARQQGLELVVMPGVARLYDEALQRGEGSLDNAAAFRFPIAPVSKPGDLAANR